MPRSRDKSLAATWTLRSTASKRCVLFWQNGTGKRGQVEGARYFFLNREEAQVINRRARDHIRSADRAYSLLRLRRFRPLAQSASTCWHRGERRRYLYRRTLLVRLLAPLREVPLMVEGGRRYCLRVARGQRLPRVRRPSATPLPRSDHT